MLFSLNEFLMAVSFALDFVEMDILGVKTNHGKRAAYVALNIAKYLGLSEGELYDIVALTILHDNGLCEKSLQDRVLGNNSINIRNFEDFKEHCIIGEKNIGGYPFLTNVKNVIKYHHESYDGSGYFNVKGEDIPLMAQIIKLVDYTDLSFNFADNNCDLQDKIIKFVNSQKNKMFSERLVNAFNYVSKHKEFWINLKDENIDESLKRDTPNYYVDMPIEKVRKITIVFSNIIDSKSKYTRRHSKDLSSKVEIMANYYKKDNYEKMKLLIASDLHDMGKLGVPNSILDSPNKLSNEEFKVIKKHPCLTRLALQQIRGFEDITEWASNHHEKLNGKGYPFEKKAEELDFNSRLMTCLDIYEALTEDRPYRKPLKHEEAMEILYKMTEEGLIDSKIIKDINKVFKLY